MTTTPALSVPAKAPSDAGNRIRAALEYIAIPVFAVIVSGLLFAVFLLFLGKSPVEFYSLVWRGGFGTAFSWQNTLSRAAPLILTALCVAIPARIGLVIIGGEGAFVLGGFAAAAVAIPTVGVLAPWGVTVVMVGAALATGGVWIALAGYLRHQRGVNETISSLLLFYIAVAIMNFFVEGALRDPSNPNKPSTMPIGEAHMVGNLPGLDVHWGLLFGIVLCIGFWVLIERTTFGFALRMTGGNARAALAQGLPVGKLIIAATALAGACAGLAGFFEVAAIHGNANASLVAGYGFTGILVAFLARHNPLAIPFVAILFGGLAAAGGLVQRRMDLPDATILLLQGLVFVVLLASETLYGRIAWFQPRAEASRP